MSSVSLLGNSTINYDGTNFTINNDPTTYIGPLTIESNLNEQITVLLNFTAPITTNTDYIIININNVIFDGHNSIITVDITDYPGLFVYNDLSNLDNIIIQNISINATNSAILLYECGWICSENFINTTVNNCSSNGPIPIFGGGIFGQGVINCIANNCYSSGYISINGGGIFGNNCNNNATNSNCYAYNCYSTGNIKSGSGGIFGPVCNNNATNSNCYAYNCYSTGIIGIDNTGCAGGIFGAGVSILNDCNCYANNCSSYGKINRGGNGGIYGSFSVNCQANNCFSIGDIGAGSGGIFFAAYNSSANNCYSIGNIEEDGGGIFAIAMDCIATNCYSMGNIGIRGGGIFGRNGVYYPEEIYTNNNTAIFCYSLGSLASSNSGGIFAVDNESCIINNCYVLGSSLYGIDITNITIDSHSRVASVLGTWNDDEALITFNNNIDSDWIVIGNNIPFLLSSFTNINYAIPIGYQYFYNLTDMTPITTNGEKTLTFLIGFYKNINNQNTTIITSGMYGYNIITKTVTVNISRDGGGSDKLPPFLIPLLDEQINFNPQWFD